MASKPSDFYIGVVDFFSIVLPGAVLSFLALDAAKRHVFGSIISTIGPGIEGWIAFAIASYLLGHFASLIGAAFLDPLYSRTYVQYKKRGGNMLYRYANELKNKSLGEHSKIVNAYKWARATVRFQSAPATQEIDRLEADSKFFRSLTVVLIAAAARGESRFHPHCDWTFRALLLEVLRSSMEIYRDSVPIYHDFGDRVDTAGRVHYGLTCARLVGYVSLRHFGEDSRKWGIHFTHATPISCVWPRRLRQPRRSISPMDL